MTQQQKEQITRLRAAGTSFGKIASVLGISVNTVKSYCKRNPVSAENVPVPQTAMHADRCPQCSALLRQTPGHRQKRFCSPKCRMAWWKAHPEQMNRKKVVQVECRYCGVTFFQYGSRQRKFCSRDCYLAHRYEQGGDRHAGDLLLQKSFVEDHISKISRKNRGEMPQYFIQNDHEAIISQEVFGAAEKERLRRKAKFCHSIGEKSELSSKVRCGICDKNYRRKTTPTRILWCCSTYNTRGKKYCASKAIPEMTLREVCCQALGLVEYDPQAVASRILQIDAMPENRLIFHLSDGTDREIQWTFPSRSESWTEEKRQKAAEQARRRHAKTSR